MATLYRHNPFSSTASIEEIVFRMVSPDEQPEVDVEQILEGRTWDPKSGTFEDGNTNSPPTFIEIIYSDVNNARIRETEAKEQGGTPDTQTTFSQNVVDQEIKLRRIIDLTRELKIEADVLRRSNNISDTGLKLASHAMADDSPIEFFAGVMRDGTGMIDIFFQFQTFGCQFIQPGEDQYQREADGQYDDHQPDQGIG